MIKIITFLFFVFSPLIFAVENFVIEFNNDKVFVKNPSKESKTVTISLNNNTSEVITAAFESKGSQMSTVAIFPGEPHVVDYSLEYIKSLSLVPLSPPSRTIEFKFDGRSYEISEEN